MTQAFSQEDLPTHIPSGTRRVLVTGRPGVGKTTLVRRAIAGLSRPVRGFYTQEVRNRGRRVGFQVHTLSGKSGWLAHVSRRSGPRVGRYRVDVAGFEALVLPELDPRAPRETLFLLDEIGPMELLSPLFQERVERLFEGPWPLLATVVLRPHPFVDALKSRDDVFLIHLTPENREAWLQALRHWLEEGP